MCRGRRRGARILRGIQGVRLSIAEGARSVGSRDMRGLCSDRWLTVLFNFVVSIQVHISRRGFLITFLNHDSMPQIEHNHTRNTELVNISRVELRTRNYFTTMIKCFRSASSDLRPRATNVVYPKAAIDSADSKGKRPRVTKWRNATPSISIR